MTGEAASRLAWPTLEWGEATVTVLSDGVLRLDGGAMFGVVPKVLWERKLPADERNRIRLSMNGLLIERGGERIVVEVGVGGKEDAKFRDIYGIERHGGLEARLAEAGAPVESIDRVIVTHLHFDHAGGATRLDDDGEAAVPAFPNATYHLSRDEYDEAIRPIARNEASYFEENFVPLVEAGVVEWIEGAGEIAPGIEAIETPGHTAHHVSIALDDGDGGKLVFLGDLVPTTHHLPGPWIMAYDLYPVTTLETKEALLPRIHEAGWLCAFVHDAERPLAYLAPDEKGRLVADEERDPWSA